MLANGNAKPGLLVLVAADGRLGPAEDVYAVRQTASLALVDEIDTGELQQVEVIITSGARGLSEAEMQTMPQLRFVHVLGSGIDKLDIEAAARRGIIVASGAGSNAASVADHAIGLALAILRDIPRFHAAASGGLWQPSQRPTLSGKSCGILGFGAIGEAIANRLTGFGVRISYHSRRLVPGSPHVYRATPTELASDVDVLFACLPGGASTNHLIDAGLLNALGPKGYLVNVGRGSVVDSDALASALIDGTIAGAAIDVFESEPNLPGALKQVRNLIVTPHVAGLTSEALDAAWARVFANLQAFRHQGDIIGRLV